jgi:hypothetical protein
LAQKLVKDVPELCRAVKTTAVENVAMVLVKVEAA